MKQVLLVLLNLNDDDDDDDFTNLIIFKFSNIFIIFLTNL